MNFQNGELDEPSMLDARGWSKLLEAYKSPSNRRALFELSVTVLPFIALWVLMYWSLQVSYLLTLLLAVPAAGFLVRLFIVQHDCGHGSFTRHGLLNRWLGRVLGVFTFTPYDYWQRTHAMHHASSGNLEHRGWGDINTLTVDEYLARDFWGRLKYRLYRNPLILFVIGPAYVFLFEQRLPFGMMRQGWKPWLSTMLTNLGILSVFGFIAFFIGWAEYFLIQLPVILMAASMGVWLFFVQHQFEDTVWEEPPEWDRREAAMHGSSHYVLPAPLQWLTGNIGIHHVHHLSSHIPFYRLPQVLRDYPELADMSRITLFESFKCARLTLWDKDGYRMISFREAFAKTAAT